jgi:hypothetical protein
MEHVRHLHDPVSNVSQMLHLHHPLPEVLVRQIGLVDGRLLRQRHGGNTPVERRCRHPEVGRVKRERVGGSLGVRTGLLEEVAAGVPEVGDDGLKDAVHPLGLGRLAADEFRSARGGSPAEPEPKGLETALVS